MADKPASLSEVCAPIFLYLTAFRRNAESSPLEVEGLRAELQREFDRAERACERDRRLSQLFQRARYALVCAADQVVLGSNWPHRAAWSLHLLEQHYFHSLEGGKKFFRVVDEVLADSANDAGELAGVLFTCMALGFQGELLGDRRELDRRRQLLFEKSRLRGALGDKLAPECYGRNSPRGQIQLPTAGIVRFVLVALGAILFALLAGDAVTRFKNRQANAEIHALTERVRGGTR